MSGVDGPAPVVLIDGRSGAGKTSLAAGIAGALTGATVIHMDDLYPGWEGLDEASALLVEWILAPRASGRPAVWRRWDWQRSERAEAHTVDPARPLIVEGCGALSRASAAFATATLWLDAPPSTREDRLSRRDGTVDWWPAWTAQEDSFIAREQPRELAGTVIDGGASSENVLGLAMGGLVSAADGALWRPWVPVS